MEKEKDRERSMSRRQFIQTCGGIVAGVGMAGALGYAFHRSLTAPTGSTTSSFGGGAIAPSGSTALRSPYKLVSALHTPAAIDALEVGDNRMVVAAGGQVIVYDFTGKELQQFAVAGTVRDLALADGLLYVLHPQSVKVYRDGTWVRQWETCDSESDYCFMALSPEAVYVTDAARKNICQFTRDGELVRFIESPDGFIVPSYSFGIAFAGGTLYCSNPGRHRVESYQPDGTFIASFGKLGNDPGSFCGCCNPVHLTVTASGDLLTSEKGIPRISCYSPKGEYRTLLLDSPMLGGGNSAYDVKAFADRLVVAGKDKLMTFRYDAATADRTACAGCTQSCPLRAGINL
ncbi:MAG: hypothetical protein LBN06_03930 [Prevotellaceae bacterium]|jgi:hypothetical protein|nr:hypothetical protein [Prevotellaceae bacterium]